MFINELNYRNKIPLNNNINNLNIFMLNKSNNPSFHSLMAKLQALIHENNNQERNHDNY